LVCRKSGEQWPGPLLSADDLAAWLGKPENAVDIWRRYVKGSRAIRVGGSGLASAVSGVTG
jgi:hypothetical protein